MRGSAGKYDGKWPQEGITLNGILPGGAGMGWTEACEPSTPAAVGAAKPWASKHGCQAGLLGRGRGPAPHRLTAPRACIKACPRRPLAAWSSHPVLPGKDTGLPLDKVFIKSRLDLLTAQAGCARAARWLGPCVAVARRAAAWRLRRAAALMLTPPLAPRVVSAGVACQQPAADGQPDRGPVHRHG